MMETINLVIWIVVGIAMFFVGRCLGYREAMQDLAEQIVTNVKLTIRGVNEQIEAVNGNDEEEEQND